MNPVNTTDRQCVNGELHAGHRWFGVHTPLNTEYYCGGVGVLATCQEHGDQEFVRCEPCQWWHCPQPECKSVIPDENVTPDGADVIVWWVSAGHCPPIEAQP